MTAQPGPISGLDIPPEVSQPDDVPVIDVDAAIVNPPISNQEIQQLAQLLALYDQLELEAAEAAEKFDTVKTAVKAIGYELRPDDDARSLEIHSKHLRTPLRMVYRPGRRSLNRKRLEVAYPGLNLTVFEEEGKSSWSLVRVKDTSE